MRPCDVAAEVGTGEDAGAVAALDEAAVLVGQPRRTTPTDVAEASRCPRSRLALRLTESVTITDLGRGHNEDEVLRTSWRRDCGAGPDDGSSDGRAVAPSCR